MSVYDEKLKPFGFGLMRLPQKEGTTEIDVEMTKEMVDLYLEAGFNYFDTAFVYPGSEDAIRQALVERYPRESYRLATKLAAWYSKTKEEAQAQFEESLKKTGAGYFDFYLLHNLGPARTEVFDTFDIWNFVQEKKAQGLIKHVGFSFHAGPKELDEILTAHPEVEFVQLQLNYADWENSTITSRANYEVARKHNVPISIMEPVKGGLLADPPQVVKDVFDATGRNESYASWALKFAANLDGVFMVLSGMSAPDQVKENVKMMQDFSGLTEDDLAVIKKAQEAMDTIPIVPCTSCKYCEKVCPNNIGVSGSFFALNSLILYDNMEFAKGRFNWQVKMQGKDTPDNCVKCGLCEQACPQQIKIREKLEEAVTRIMNA